MDNVKVLNGRFWLESWFIPKITDQTRKELQKRIYALFKSQSKFCLEVSKSTTYVSEVVQGHRDPPLRVKKEWAEVLQCDSRDIFPE